jgi:hypothetical protein
LRAPAAVAPTRQGVSSGAVAIGGIPSMLASSSR